MRVLRRLDIKSNKPIAHAGRGLQEEHNKRTARAPCSFLSRLSHLPLHHIVLDLLPVPLVDRLEDINSATSEEVHCSSAAAISLKCNPRKAAVGLDAFAVAGRGNSWGVS